MKSLLLVPLFAAIISGAQYIGLKFKVDLAKPSIYVNAQTNEYCLGLEEKSSGELYLINSINSTNELIKAESMPNAIRLETGLLGPLAMLGLFAFFKARRGLIDWDSFVTSASEVLTPAELMNLPKTIWDELSLNQIAMLLGKIPDNAFVGATIIRLEKEGKPVDEIIARAHAPGEFTGVPEGTVVASGDSLFTILVMKMIGKFHLPFNSKVEKKLVADDSTVSIGQLLYVFSKQ